MKRKQKFLGGYIINVDLFRGAKSLKDNSAQVMFCDPPYNLSTASKMKVTRLKTGWKGLEEKWDIFKSDKEYIKFTIAWLKQAKRILKPNGTIWITGTFHNIGIINFCLRMLDFYILNDVIWYKVNAAPNFTCRQFCSSHETVIWARRSKKPSNHIFNYEECKNNFADMFHHTHINVRHNGSGYIVPKKNLKQYLLQEPLQMRDMWAIPIIGGKENLRFPTQKPEELLRRCLTASSNENDLIVDFFGGSGTTAYVARKMRRKYIVFEKSAKHFKLMYHRMCGNAVMWDRDQRRSVQLKE